MYSTYNEGKLVIAEELMKTLRSKMYKEMSWHVAANVMTASLYYLNELVDDYNNTYHRFIDKKLVDANYSMLCEKIESNN